MMRRQNCEPIWANKEKGRQDQKQTEARDIDNMSFSLSIQKNGFSYKLE